MTLHRQFSLDTWTENFGIAFDALRISKLRSGLTILGVVIGVATVMTMASMVQGIEKQITNAIEVAGPTTFYVMKVFNTSPVNPENLPKWIRIRPDLTAEEADRIARLPEVLYAGIWAQIQASLEYAGQRTRPTIVTGADDHFQDIQGVNSRAAGGSPAWNSGPARPSPSFRRQKRGSCLATWTRSARPS